MSLNVTIAREAKIAIYRQIAEQIKTQISNGRLPASTRLPTVRKLATDLGVTRITVQNAYNELQAGGWVEATVGRGTFVSPSVQQISLENTPPRALTPDSALGHMLELGNIVGVRSMAMAHPDPALFPVDEFWGHLIRSRRDAAEIMHYGPIQGDANLRVEIANWVQMEDGISAVPEEIHITAGAMQAISLAARVLTEPGDTVLVEQPTFLGTLNILKAERLHWLGVPLEEDGPDLERLEWAMRTQQPKFFYTVSNFHNPTGICTSAEKRHAILALAERYDCTIIEDNIYARLWYDAPPPPSLKALDQSDRVVHIGGFSKMLMPGLRIGYLIAPFELRTPLLTLRRSTDLCGVGLTQRPLADFLHDGGLKRHLRRILPVYRQRRDSLLHALQTHMPEEVAWSRPRGGFCTWLTMPRLRLCFANLSEVAIGAGIELLSKLIRQRLRPVIQPPTGDWMPIL